MPGHISSRVLHRSPLSWVADVRCHAGRCGCAAEEWNREPSIVLVRRGVFIKHEEGEAVTADAGTVLFFRVGRPYRASHPVDGGDDCTSIGLAPGLLREAVGRFDPRAAEDRHGPLAFSHGPADAGTYLAQASLVRALARGEL